MATYDCDDFRVTFAPDAPGSYQVISRAADGREVSSTFSLPMSTDRLEQAVLQLGRLRSREVAPENISAVRTNAEELGDELGRALFDGPLGPFYDEARQTAAANRRGVRLTLSLASTPELLSVPWEILYRRPTFLASQRRTPIVRYLELGQPPAPVCIDDTVRILGVVASPRGLPELDVHEERTRVVKALAGMSARGLVELDWCDPATPRSLRECLRDGSYHILHYVGHSDFSDGAGLLFLEDDEGGPAQVTESVLTNLLGDQTSLRLAILNSCEGARTTLTDPFAGIATNLVALGVPAVVAMQFAISDRAAIVFAEELFTSLIGRQYPIDAAVSEARKAVFTEVNEIEWATPVLFMQSADGQLFDFVAEPVTLPLPAPPTQITVAALPPPAPAPAAGESPPPAPPPVHVDATPPPPRRRIGRVIAAGVGVAIALVVAVLLLTRSDDSDETDSTDVTDVTDVTDGSLVAAAPLMAITPESGPMGTEILIRGDPCPEPPKDTVFTAISTWLNIGGVTAEDQTIANVDAQSRGDEEWHASLVVPVDDEPGAFFYVGAVCWARNSAGDSDNFYEFPSINFDVTAP